MTRVHTPCGWVLNPLEIKEMVADIACKPSNSLHDILMTEITAYQTWSRWHNIKNDVHCGEIDDENDLHCPLTLEEIFDDFAGSEDYYNDNRIIYWGIQPSSVRFIQKNGIEMPQTIRCKYCEEPRQYCTCGDDRETDMRCEGWEHFYDPDFIAQKKQVLQAYGRGAKGWMPVSGVAYGIGARDCLGRRYNEQGEWVCDLVKLCR